MTMQNIYDVPEWVTAFAKKDNTAFCQKEVKLFPWSSLSTLERGKYLIKGLLDKGSMSVVYGESNSGKTFFALDVAAHISLGWKWRGKNTRQGRVIYIGAESGLGIADRLEAFRRYHELDEYGDIHLIPHTINLSSDHDECSMLIDKVNAVGGAELIVIDTLARSMGSSDENSSGDMGFFIACCDKIRAETGAHVMVIHHSGKDTSKGARGHSSLRAAIDTEIQVLQSDGVITAQVVKQRDGKVGGQFGFKLEVIEVGLDEDGDPVTSCALSGCDPVQKTKPLSEQKRRALSILHNCLLDKGQKRRIRSDMAEVKCVTLTEYREYLVREKLSSSDKPDSASKAITRAIDSLNNAGITCSYENYIWIVDKQDKAGQVFLG